MAQGLLNLVKAINYQCSVLGRRGSIVTPVFPVGWGDICVVPQSLGIDIPNQRFTEYKQNYFKYIGFKGKLLAEVTNCGTRFAIVEIMGNEISFPVKMLDFIVEKDAREEVAAEVRKEYKQKK